MGWQKYFSKGGCYVGVSGRIIQGTFEIFLILGRVTHFLSGSYTVTFLPSDVDSLDSIDRALQRSAFQT